MKQTEISTHVTHVNGWEPAVYMSCMSQNFRLFHVSNLSVRNFRIFLLMYPGPVSAASIEADSVLGSSSDTHGYAHLAQSPSRATLCELQIRRLRGFLQSDIVTSPAQTWSKSEISPLNEGNLYKHAC